MDLATKQAIIAYVAAKDPHHSVVQLKPNPDLSGGTILFASAMKQHRVETALTGEKYAEAYLAVKLVKELNYPANCLELQREYPAGHPKVDRPRIDWIVNQLDGPKLLRAFLFIEVKDPDQFEAEHDYAIERQLYPLADHERVNNLAYLAYFSVEFDGMALREKVEIIDFQEFPTYTAWKDAGNLTLDLIPADYGLARKSSYVNKPPEKLGPGEKALNATAGPEVFNALRTDLHNVLWAGGGMFYNDIFSNLVKIVLAKIYDEETTAEGEAYIFQIQLVGKKPESPSAVYDRINGRFQEAQKHYLGYSDAQVQKSKGIDPEKISENKVAYVVGRLQHYSLIRNAHPGNGDVLGQFFEGIVEQGFKQSRGQFFTHLNIVRFLLAALRVPEVAVDLVSGSENPAKPRLPFICDPACGSGTFLIETMRAVTTAIATSPRLKKSVKNQQFLEAMFPPSKPNRWADTYIYGTEVNADLALATKVNMVLHGDGSINIFAKDGLAPFAAYALPDKVSALLNTEKSVGYPYEYERNERFDFILTNPPFSIKPDDSTKEDYRRRFEFGESPRSETLFLERWYQLLKEGGHAGVVLPESVFDTPTNIEIRLFLYRYFWIEAVIALPYSAFRPYTSTKTSLLLARKKSKAEVEHYSSAWKKSEAFFKRVFARVQAGFEASSEKEWNTFDARLRKHPQAELDAMASILGAERAEPDTIAKRIADLVKDRHAPPPDTERVRLTFSSVASAIDYEIFFAEADEVGYKRRKQGGDLVRPNDLFRTRLDGEIVVDTSRPTTVLERLLAPSLTTQEQKGFRSRFALIGNEAALRCDAKYRWFRDVESSKVVPSSVYQYVPLWRFLRLSPKRVVKKGELEEERKLVELEMVESGTGHLLGFETVDEVGSDKLEFGDSHIVFSKLEPYLAKAILNDPTQEYIGSTEWLTLYVNEEEAVREYMWAFLLSPAARRAFRSLQSGKRHARIHVSDFFSILIPWVPRDQQRDAVASLTPCWDRIQEMRRQVKLNQLAAEADFEKSLAG